MTKQEILVARFEEFFTLCCINPALAETFNCDYQAALGDYLVFVDHAEEMLQMEEGRHTVIAVTNGTKAAQTKKLMRSGLDRIFNAVFISEDVGYQKPNAEYFKTVFRKTSIADKKQVLLIGDSLTSDMKDGEIAGIDTCWYNPKHSTNTQKIPVTYEIDNLSRIMEILD